MQAFWQVLASDLRAAGLFAVATLLLAVPAAAVGAFAAAYRRWTGTQGLASCAARGALFGIAFGVLVAMLVEFAFELEGLVSYRQLVRDNLRWGLAAAAIVVAGVRGYWNARREAEVRKVSEPSSPPRTFTLRQLLLAQVVLAALFGWWAFTRKGEIGRRSEIVAREARLRADQKLFAPFGLNVTASWPDDSDLIAVGSVERQQTAGDEALQLVVDHGKVAHLMVVSDAVTNQGLNDLARSNCLRDLTITSSTVTDDGLARLSDSPSLRYVAIRSRLITGVGLKQLVGLRSLQWLRLEDTQVTAKDVAEFQKLRPDVTVDLGFERFGAAESTGAP